MSSFGDSLKASEFCDAKNSSWELGAEISAREKIYFGKRIVLKIDDVDKCQIQHRHIARFIVSRCLNNAWCISQQRV